MRGSNENMTRSSSVVTRHDRRGSCVVITADGPGSSQTAVILVTFSMLDSSFKFLAKVSQNLILGCS